MKPIFRILQYLKYFPLRVGLNITFNVLHIVFNLGSYIMIVPFVELLFGLGSVPDAEPTFHFSQQGIADWAFFHLNRSREELGLWQCLLIIAGGYLACSFLSNLCRFVAMSLLANIRNSLIERLRNDLYHKITILPISRFNRQRRGDLISRMSNDLADIDWSVVSTLQMLVKDPINALFFSATLIFVSWRLFLLFLLVLPAGVWLIARIGKSLKRNSQRGQEELGRLFSLLEESLGGLRVIKNFSREESTAARFNKTNEAYTHTILKVARRRELSSPLSEILGTLALVIILFIGGWQVIDGYISPSVFIFFVIIFARLIPPIQSIVKAYNNLQKGSASAARFLEILDADEQIVQQPDAFVLPPFSSHIEFRGVGLRFEDGETGLSDINLSISRGQTVALVGPSGAGKSTLVDLLPRFRDVSEGSILFDGHPLPSVDILSLRSQFAIVSQNPILFNDTIANNISFGQQSSREDIVRAAQVACADDFISSLPQGYDTPIGDRGLNLSGGQRQRLSIARAVLRNAPILILDEATSALDSENELSVQQALRSAMQGHTCIIIAHRLSTIRHADLIVVMDHGHILEQGTHESLLAAQGLYFKMVSMQNVS